MAANQVRIKGTFTMDADNAVPAVWESLYQDAGDSDGVYLLPDKILSGWTHMSVELEALTTSQTDGMAVAEFLKIGTGKLLNDGSWKASGGTKIDTMLDSAGDPETADLATDGDTYGPRSVGWAIKNADDPTCQLDAYAYGFTFHGGHANSNNIIEIIVTLTRAGA